MAHAQWLQQQAPTSCTTRGVTICVAFLPNWLIECEVTGWVV
jgi:hypothetical protein